MTSCFIHCPPPFNSEQVRVHFFIQSSFQNESGYILSARRNILAVLLFFVEGKNETGGQHASSFVRTTERKTRDRKLCHGRQHRQKPEAVRTVRYGTVLLLLLVLFDGLIIQVLPYWYNRMRCQSEGSIVPYGTIRVSKKCCQSYCVNKNNNL